MKSKVKVVLFCDIFVNSELMPSGRWSLSCLSVNFNGILSLSACKEWAQKKLFIHHDNVMRLSTEYLWPAPSLDGCSLWCVLLLWDKIGHFVLAEMRVWMSDALKMRTFLQFLICSLSPITFKRRRRRVYTDQKECGPTTDWQPV